MKKIFLVISLLWVNGVMAEFLPQTEDVPLMEGIEVQDSEVFSFDSPSGQILTIEGKTDIKPADIKAFYAETLPSMGWNKTALDTYVRGTDFLVISFPNQGQVHFDMTLSNQDKN